MPRSSTFVLVDALGDRRDHVQLRDVHDARSPAPARRPPACRLRRSPSSSWRSLVGAVRLLVGPDVRPPQLVRDEQQHQHAEGDEHFADAPAATTARDCPCAARAARRASSRESGAAAPAAAAGRRRGRRLAAPSAAPSSRPCGAPPGRLCGGCAGRGAAPAPADPTRRVRRAQCHGLVVEPHRLSRLARGCAGAVGARLCRVAAGSGRRTAPDSSSYGARCGAVPGARRGRARRPAPAMRPVPVPGVALGVVPLLLRRLGGLLRPSAPVRCGVRPSAVGSAAEPGRGVPSGRGERARWPGSGSFSGSASCSTAASNAPVGLVRALVAYAPFASYGLRRVALGAQGGHAAALPTTGASPADRPTAPASPHSHQPVGEHQVAALRQHRLGVELHALDRQFAVAQPHDDAVRPCAR